MTKDCNVMSVPGFLSNGIHVGIKNDGRKDLAIIFSSVPSQAVGMFTTNIFKAAPVMIDMVRINNGTARAIVINSGNANAATGDRGYADALAVSSAVAKILKVGDDQILLASTGIIGQHLPLNKIIGGLKKLSWGLRNEGIEDAGEAIMTTDKFPKISHCKGMIGKKEVTLCGIAKGAGMISPNLATMLAFFFTDASIEFSALQSIFCQAVNASFNSITVDGCMSTNDTVIMLANGFANNQPIKKGSKDFASFKEMLLLSMRTLANAIVRDGEGSTKVIEIQIEDASSLTDAKRAAYAIANSNLVKTAFYGCDPNWGRVISALGSVDLKASPNAVKVFFEEVPVFAQGTAIKGHIKRLSEIMAQSSIKLKVNIGSGRKKFTLFTSDLGYEYVKINAHYHT